MLVLISSKATSRFGLKFTKGWHYVFLVSRAAICGAIGCGLALGFSQPSLAQTQSVDLTLSSEHSLLADSLVAPVHLVSAKPAPYGALDQQLGVSREQNNTQISQRKRPDAVAESFKRMPFNTSDIINYGLKGKADIVRNQMEYNMEAWLRGQVESSLENMSQN